MKRILILLVLLATFMCLVGCDGGGGNPGNLDGYVYVTTGGARSLIVRGLDEDILDNTYMPLMDATVSISDKTGITNASGFFTITGINPGTYTVSVNATGFQTLSIGGVVITSDQTTHLSYRDITFAAKTWNFLVYLDGDNNLEPFAISDLNEMEQIGSTDEVNILVLIDRSPGWTDPVPGDDTSNGNWTGTRIYYVTQDANTSAIGSTLLADLGERDMSDPATLRDFILYCQEHFPATRTCLTLWNHGGGVYPRNNVIARGKKEGEGTAGKAERGQASGARGICWDDTTGTGAWDCLTTDEVAQALAEARGVTSQKIDVINMDACLTQMLEVAYEWRNEADYLVGSEETVPGNGNDYATVLGHLTGSPSMSASTFATALVDDYYNFYNGSEDTTYSAINLGSPFTTLMSSFTSFATALRNSTKQSEIYDAWWNTTFFTSDEQNDLYDFATELIASCTDSAVTNAANSLQTAIAGAVLHHHETGIYIGYAYGIGILIASAGEWPYYNGSSQYALLDISANTNWNEFLDNFAGLRVVGTWTINFSWLGTASIYFYSDHTFQTQTYNGVWRLNGDVVEWIFTSGTTYTGTVNAAGDYMSGTMLDYNGVPGTWNASR